MMPRLLNASRNSLLAQNLETADRFVSRLVGLLGRAGLGEGHALWIKKCASIHTFFMRFTIDAVFVDRDLKVRGVRENLRPGRMTIPIWHADSVFELPAGSIRSSGTTVGDQLHVVD